MLAKIELHYLHYPHPALVGPNLDIIYIARMTT
jgi:hypothetical protein